MASCRWTLIFVPLFLTAHPMGNFSVNHYARLDLHPHAGSTLTYVLDLAEIPTFELFQQWKLEAPNAALVRVQAQNQARQWLTGLSLTNNGERVTPHLRQVKSQLTDGAGGMPVLRVEAIADLAIAPGALAYQDANYAGRAGWKEIVVRRGNGVAIGRSSVTTPDRTNALTHYPGDVLTAPPQDLEAKVDFTFVAAPPVAAPLAAVPAPVATTPAPPVVAAPGTVVKGDYLSRLLKNQTLTPAMVLLGLAAAFALGSLHALSPGHGKTIVAAYLVGSRGTLRHALFLGAMVTVTHTASVFLLGLGVLFAQQYIVPERIIPMLGAVSGLSIVCIGAYLLYRRTIQLGHGHDHHHYAEPEPEMTYAAVAGQPTFLSVANHESAFVHTHDGHTHTHEMPAELTLKSLIALGASGGLVPCPSALVLMLSSIALGRTAFGMALLISFSAGLAIVLMAIGGLVIYAKHLLPEESMKHPAFRFVPVFSAVVVIVLGTLMTFTSLGWMG